MKNRVYVALLLFSIPAVYGLMFILSERAESSEITGFVTVVAFSAEWCEPCKKNLPELLKLQESGVSVVFIDVNESPLIANRWDIIQVPTYVVLTRDAMTRTSDIKELFRRCGVTR